MRQIGRAGKAGTDRAWRSIVDSATEWMRKAQSLGQEPETWEEALSCFDRAIELDPSLAEAWRGKGLLLALPHRLQNREQALQCLERAHELGDPQAREFVEAAKSLPAVGSALHYSLRVPQSFQLQVGDSDRARLEALKQEAELSLALVHLLKARLLAREFGKAQALAQRAIDLASQWPNSWVSKAIRCHAHGWFFYDAKSAIAVFGGAEQMPKLMNSDSLENHYTKGIGGLCGGKHAAALASLRAAERLQPNNPYISCCMAIVLIEQSSPEAFDVVHRCCARHTDHPLLDLIQFHSAV